MIILIKAKLSFSIAPFMSDRRFLLSCNGSLLVCMDIKVVHEKSLFGNPFLQVGERKRLSPENRQSRINCNLTKIDH